MSATIWATLLTTLPTTKSTSMSTFMSATMSTFMCFFTGADRRPQRLKHRWERLPKHIDLLAASGSAFQCSLRPPVTRAGVFFRYGRRNKAILRVGYRYILAINIRTVRGQSPPRENTLLFVNIQKWQSSTSHLAIHSQL